MKLSHNIVKMQMAVWLVNHQHAAISLFLQVRLWKLVFLYFL